MGSADQNNPLAGYGIAPPPSGGNSKKSTVHPIGVPDHYHAPMQTVPVGTGHYGPYVPYQLTEYGTVPQSRQYVPGDEFGPAGDLNAIPTIQADMIAAGLLDKRDVRVGVWDAASAAAYKDVLAFANTQGVTAKQALLLLVSNPPLGGLKGAKGTREPIVSFTNPADVGAEYRNISQGLTGQEQNPAAFQGYYHGLEAQAAGQRAVAHHAATPGGTGYQEYTQAPSLTGAAQQYLLQHDPQDVAAYGVASRMMDFLSMVGK